MARGQRRKGRLWGWFTLSVLAHAGLGAAALVVRSRMPVRPPEKIYVVDLLPPAGTINGDVQGKGTPLSFPKPAPAAPKAAAPKPAALTAPHEPAAKPAVHSDAAEPAPAPTKTDKEKQTEELREAVRRSMLKTEETPPEGEHKGPEGTGDKPPLGTPEGVPGGKGKAGMAASYKAVLAGWFVARLSCRSVSDVPPDELKKLTVRADISLSPGRTVTSFSVASSGNDAYDAHVRSTLQSIQSQGITLPESPEGDEPPPHLTVNFRCNKG